MARLPVRLLAIGLMIGIAGPAFAGETRRAPPPAQGVSTCSVAAEAGEVRRVRAALAGIKLADDNDGSDVPPAARSGVPALRAGLAAAIARHMECNNEQPADAWKIEPALAKLLDANRAGGASEPSYGGNLRIAVKPVPAMDDVLAVDASFTIPCGEDHVLAMFEKRPEGWRRVLDWRAAKFERMSDAFGDFFDYAAVPGEGDTKLIAVAHGTPWCTSGWSRFAVDLIAPATDTAQQKVLAHDMQSYNRAEDPVTFDVASDGFVIGATVASRDDEVPRYRGIFHYDTTGRTLVRRAFAPGIGYFIDAWLSEPWAVASRWSVQPAARLKPVHDRLNAKGGAPAIRYNGLFACGWNTFQARIDLGDKTRLYARVYRTGQLYLMMTIRPTPDRACTDSLHAFDD